MMIQSKVKFQLRNRITNTFETVHGSMSWMTLDVGHSSPKAAPKLARVLPPSMGKPGQRVFARLTPTTRVADLLGSSRAGQRHAAPGWVVSTGRHAGNRRHTAIIFDKLM
jgi:hypothetical protein